MSGAVERCAGCGEPCPAPCGMSTLKYRPGSREVWCEACVLAVMDQTAPSALTPDELERLRGASGNGGGA